MANKDLSPYRDNRKTMTEPCGMNATSIGGMRDEDRSQVSSELGVLDVRTDELVNRLSALMSRLDPILNDIAKCPPDPSGSQISLVPLAERIRNYSERVGAAIDMVNRTLGACEL